jgi:hypothetical protein
MEVFNALNELRNYIMPKDDCKSEITLSFDDLINWANKLEKGRTYAFIAYLFWVTEILNNRRNEQ